MHFKKTQLFLNHRQRLQFYLYVLIFLLFKPVVIRVVIEKSLVISYISGWVVGTIHNHGQKIPFYLYVYSMYRCIDVMLLKLKRFPLFATFIIYPFDRSVIL